MCFINVDIFVSLKRQPSVNEKYWMGLLQDMLAMQKNVYNCLRPDTCYEVIVSFSPQYAVKDTLQFYTSLYLLCLYTPKSKQWKENGRFPA